MAKGHILGFPRMGEKRELKFALESFWRGESDESYLRNIGRELRQRHWQLQADAGLNFVSVGDFAYYDQMLSQGRPSSGRCLIALALAQARCDLPICLLPREVQRRNPPWR